MAAGFEDGHLRPDPPARPGYAGALRPSESRYGGVGSRRRMLDVRMEKKDGKYCPLNTRNDAKRNKMKSRSEMNCGKYSSLQFSVLSTSPQSGKWPLSPCKSGADVARLSGVALASAKPPAEPGLAKTDVSRAMIFCLSALFLSTVTVFAESYPNRPTADEMDGYVVQGIICGNAMHERELAVDRSQSFLPYCGVWQPYIVSLQQELETLAPLYIDHENGPLTYEEDDFLCFDLDNWRAVAGLNADGFRRSTDGTTFYYGKMQVGDIIGAWIFEDMQKGFGAIKWLPFFRDIVNVRTLFPQVTGMVDYHGSGSGTDFGVWYPLDEEWLGESGTYRISLDTRLLKSYEGYFHISLGRTSSNTGQGPSMKENGGGLVLDSEHQEPPGNLTFAASVTFLDPSSLVQVYGCNCVYYNDATPSSSFGVSLANVSASLDTSNGGGFAYFIFFPVIKVPFVNQYP